MSIIYLHSLATIEDTNMEKYEPLLDQVNGHMDVYYMISLYHVGYSNTYSNYTS